MDFLAWPALGLISLIRITWQSSLGQAYQTVASSNLISLLPAASLDTKQVLPLKLSTKEDNAHKVKRSVSPHQQVPILAPPQSHTQHHHAGIAALAQSDELKHNLLSSVFACCIINPGSHRCKQKGCVLHLGKPDPTQSHSSLKSACPASPCVNTYQFHVWLISSGAADTDVLILSAAATKKKALAGFSVTTFLYE